MSAPLDIAPGIETMVVDDEVLVFDGTMIHLMSGSGAEVWTAVDGRRTRDQIADALSRRHGPAVDVTDDVVGYLDDLLARGLVVESVRRRDDELMVPDQVAWVSDDRLVVVLDLLSGERHTLNLTASRAWLLLARGVSRGELLERLSDEFPDAPATLERELDDLCAALLEQGLLTRRD
jgi:hypothetical protein